MFFLLLNAASALLVSLHADSSGFISVSEKVLKLCKNKFWSRLPPADVSAWSLRAGWGGTGCGRPAGPSSPSTWPPGWCREPWRAPLAPRRRSNRNLLTTDFYSSCGVFFPTRIRLKHVWKDRKVTDCDQHSDSLTFTHTGSILYVMMLTENTEVQWKSCFVGQIVWCRNVPVSHFHTAIIIGKKISW